MLHRLAAGLAHLPLLSGVVPVAGFVVSGVVFIVSLAIMWSRFRRGRGRSGLSAAIGVLGLAASLLLAGALQVNFSLTRYPTAAVALGHAPVLPNGGRGTLIDIGIPGTVSGFVARPATVYLPATYGSVPNMPVLVLLTGQPGHVIDWIEGGHLAATMDTFAAQHRGLAPVVVVADGLGDTDANPMCMDSRLGRAATYLSVDVPEWMRAHFDVAADPQKWAIGGYSYGGTCALQMATTAPSVYPTFIDISGEDEQRRGTRAESVSAAFGLDDPATEFDFERVTPLNILSRNRFTDSSGAFVVGAGDEEFRLQTERAYAAAVAAGMDAHYRELPGGHSMEVWAPALEGEMEWLGQRLGLID